jgi:hypothetical protein
VLLHPLRYRTELCKDFVQRGFCARDVCFFAHFPSEQRTPDEETMVRYNVLQARLLTSEYVSTSQLLNDCDSGGSWARMSAQRSTDM